MSRMVTPKELDCPICMKLLLEPISLSCGHSFCRVCLRMATDYRQTCPVCRASCPESGNVNIVLNNLIQEQYPEDYAARLADLEQEQNEENRFAAEERSRQLQGGVAGYLPILFSPFMAWPYVLNFIELQGETHQNLIRFASRNRRDLIVCPLKFRDRNLGVVCEVHRSSSRSQLVLKGKVRHYFNRELVSHPEGWSMAQLQDPYFDFSDFPSANAQSLLSQSLELLIQHTRAYGEAGKLEFAMRFGDMPTASAVERMTNVALEEKSFWICSCLILSQDDAHNLFWVQNTISRFERLVQILNGFAIGRKDVLNIDSSLSVFTFTSSKAMLLVVLILLLFGMRAYGIFDPPSYQHKAYLTDNLF